MRDKKKIDISTVNNRRAFIKKALYATPSIVMLSSIIKPTNAKADDFGPTPSDPNTD